MAGRPSKFTQEVQDAIIAALSIGATYKDAAEASGVAYDTFNEWMKMGQSQKSGKFSDFSELVKQTEAAARLKYLAVIENAATAGDWKAALEYLKRRDRSNWGDNVDVTTAGNKLEIVFRETKPDDTSNN
jgi:transposase-like protein